MTTHASNQPGGDGAPAKTVFRILGALAVSTVVGLVFALPDWGHGNNWPRSVLLTLLDWWSWGLLAPAIMAIDRKLRALPNGGAILAAHLVMGSVFSVAHAFVRSAIAVAMNYAALSVLVPSAFIVSVFSGPYFWGLLVYGLIVGLAQSYHYQRAARDAALGMARMERDYSEARLNALRMQLDPHFLFNALNTISAQIAAQPKQARQMISHLGDLLRASLDSGGRPEITLAEELEFLGHYLAIQTIRFGDSLRVDLHISGDAKLGMVPNLLMQPLVENAIRHGISSRARGGLITITAARNDDLLEIRVLDDGVGLPPGWSLDASRGLGLSITRERVAGLHPRPSRFTVHPGRNGGTEVAIALPYRTAGAV